MNYYNEFEPKAAWALRQLIKDGLIPEGDVDDRSITEVEPDELRKYTQCHFFAGIGGWSRALALAEWDSTKPLWTGSCPCQPFSVAGRGGGQNDPRHLWPVWFNLIRECRPPVIFGEQVEAAINHGWLDSVQDDMERESYSFASVCLPACSVSAPHIRQRLWFVANRVSDTKNIGRNRGGETIERERSEDKQIIGKCIWGELSGHNSINGMANSTSDRCFREGQRGETEEGLQQESKPSWKLSDGLEGCCTESSLADTNSIGRSGECWCTGKEKLRTTECCTAGGNEYSSEDNSFWGSVDWLYCRDGKFRPVEPGTFPLVNGFPERVGLLRASGNAIVPQVAAEVIKAFMEYERIKNA